MIDERLLTRFFREHKASPGFLKVAAGWSLLALLFLLAGYGSVRVCPRWGSCEKGALFVGGKPFIITLLVWALGIAALRLAPARLPKPPSAADEEISRRRLRRAAISFPFCALTTLAVAHLFLLSPMILHPFWAYPVRLSSNLGFPLNQDSPLLMDLAVSPGKLLESGPGDLRQSRPLYVWVAAGLTRSLAPLARRSGIERLYGVRHPAFLPEIVLNWGLLTVAFFLFWRFLCGFGGPFAKFAAVLCAIPFLANDVVKAFFWTPHMQLFNLLVPMLGLVCCRSILAGPPLSHSRALLVGLGLGLLGLAYESSLFIVPAIAAAFLLRAGGARARAGWREGLPRAGMLALGFALPQLAWIAVRLVRSGRYSNVAIERDRNFVWLADALSAGAEETGTRVFSYSVLFLRTLWSACGPLVLLGVLLVFVRLWLGLPLSPSGQARRQALHAAWLTMFSAMTFLFFMGQYVERHSFFLGPILLVLCGLLLTEVLEASAGAVRVGIAGTLAAVDAVWLVYQVAKYGPYS